ncbi:redox-sensitive transcriptional activator SoxR [Mesobacterium sp. TK19101]|uniref:Redox-sensitive transcriptional activator SoxR n=1 Tax=Mesobacterium hydrothermale TaxID=3111907 RepID=A0ABU6HIM3_9RHOB|nr:redox-sensitive transcriptional activator SoxR [Mesobacterium sp. TK19101]MEC3862308.1 redox-sensitive transcriptional activator SoxR [Mesobacterium sp. TK19101]
MPGKALRRGNLSIGDISDRTGLAPSAIRYYEEEGLIAPIRSTGGRRLFQRSDIRRLSFILIAQQLGFALSEIREELRALPEARTPTRRDWEKLSRHFRKRLETRIATLEALRDKLDGCIGCGCLSLSTCALYNAEDRAARHGQGPRYLLGDRPDN